jgi:A/G-specific adenine glycosylase
VRAFCRATEPLSLPVKTKRTAITEVTERVFFLRNDEGVLLEQETGTRRTGMWKLPSLPDAGTPPKVLHKASYSITRYKVTLWVHEVPEQFDAGARHRFLTDAELSALPMPAPHRKALNAVVAMQGAFHLEG